MQLIRFAVATVIDGAARALTMSGAAVEKFAQSVRSGGAEPTQSTSPAQSAAAPPQPAGAAQDDRRGRVVRLPDTPLLDAEPHQRRPETHVSELASQPAATVIEQIDRLSTDDLRLLFEQESSQRNRKTVLRAIENALAPAATGR